MHDPERGDERDRDAEVARAQQQERVGRGPEREQHRIAEVRVERARQRRAARTRAAARAACAPERGARRAGASRTAASAIIASTPGTIATGTPAAAASPTRAARSRRAARRPRRRDPSRGAAPNARPACSRGTAAAISASRGAVRMPLPTRSVTRTASTCHGAHREPDQRPHDPRDRIAEQHQRLLARHAIGDVARCRA